MDDSKTVTLSLDADSTVDTWLDTPRPTLIVRCKEGRTSAYVVTESAAQPEYGKYDAFSVDLRFDEARPRSEDWSSSTDDKALFSPQPIGLARRLANTGTFRFRFTPFNSSPAIATFHTAGLAERLGEVATACSWKVDGNSETEGKVTLPPVATTDDAVISANRAVMKKFLGTEVQLENWTLRGSDAARLQSVNESSFKVGDVSIPLNRVQSTRLDVILVLTFKSR